MTIKYGFLLVILSKLSSKLSANLSKTSGERYKEIKLHNLPPNDISKVIHSSKYQISNNLKARECL